MNARSFIDKDDHKDVCERIIKKEYMNYFFTQHKPDMTRVTLRIGGYNMGKDKHGKDMYHVDVWLDIANDRTFTYEEDKPIEWSYDYGTFIRRLEAVLNPHRKETAQLRFF